MKLLLYFGFIFNSVLSQVAFAASGSGNVTQTINQGGTVGFSSNGVINGVSTSNVPFTSLNKSQKTLTANDPGSTDTFLVLYDGTNPTGTQYQVASGKTFYVYKICANVTSSSATGVTFGYGTAALGSNNTGTPPTGAVYWAGTSSGPWIIYNSALHTCIEATGTFPQNTYPFVKNVGGGTTASFFMWGVEQ